MPGQVFPSTPHHCPLCNSVSGLLLPNPTTLEGRMGWCDSAEGGTGANALGQQHPVVGDRTAQVLVASGGLGGGQPHHFQHCWYGIFHTPAPPGVFCCFFFICRPTFDGFTTFLVGMTAAPGIAVLPHSDSCVFVMYLHLVL